MEKFTPYYFKPTQHCDMCGTSACRGGGVGLKTALFLLCISRIIVVLERNIKTIYVRCLPKESIFINNFVKNLYFKGENSTLLIFSI